MRKILMYIVNAKKTENKIKRIRKPVNLTHYLILFLSKQLKFRNH